MLKLTGLVLAGILLILGGIAAYVRLAPVTPARWHIDLHGNRPEEMGHTTLPPGSDPVRVLPNGAYLDKPSSAEDAMALIRRIDALAVATPRTRRVAGNPEEGHVTWETRSALWGFPDYTTAQVTPAGLAIYARQRFGRSDLGVNAARLRAWLARL